MATARRPRRRRRVAHRSVAARRGNARRAQADAVGDARTVIYVHGIGNKPIASILKCQWDTALFGFDVGERSRLAYWVNREFYPDPTVATCQSGDTIALEEQPTGRSLSLAAHLSSVSLEDEVQAITEHRRAQRTLLQIARTIEAEGAQPAATASRARGVGAKVLPLPPVLRDWITRGLVRAFLRDVNDYFFVPERRRVMRESVLERLRA